MVYSIIVFIAPLYLAIRGKWSAFILKAILYFLAWCAIILGIGFVLYALAVGQASWHLRIDLTTKHAKLNAEKA